MQSTTVPIISICIASFAALIACISAYIANKNRRQGVMPVLVFARKIQQPKDKWFLQNVGNGPALNIMIYDKGKNLAWRKVGTSYPIATKEKNEEINISHGAALYVEYT